MRSTLSFLASGILVSGLAVRPVDAATPSASISVSAWVQASCLVSATTTAFTTYAAAVGAASAVSVVCSNSTPYNVRLSPVLPRGATGVMQEMTVSGVALLGHWLSSNLQGIANRRQALSEDTAATSGTGSAPVLATHGRISAVQSTMAGAYTDTVTVVVTY